MIKSTRWMGGTFALLLIAAASVPGAQTATAPKDKAPLPAGRVTELPCPEAKPKFNYAEVDRTLKEPTYGSEKRAYRFLVFGPEGKSVMAMVADESEGTGKGVDTLYIDLNCNRDLTEADEKFKLAAKGGMKPARGNGDLAIVSLGGWGKGGIPRRKLAIPDPKFEYEISGHGGGILVDARLKDGSWKTHLWLFGASTKWSSSKDKAPIFRFGGDEFSLRNENFVRVRKGQKSTSSVGKTLKPGTNIGYNGAAPFFAGSCPGAGGGWVTGGHRNMNVFVESLEPETKDVIIKIPGYGS